MADPVDFVPDACAVAAISGCIVGSDCGLADLEIDGSANFFADLQVGGLSLPSIQSALNEIDVCFAANLALAFAAAGCTMPTLPDLPDPAELADLVGECVDRIAETTAEQANAIGEWAKALTVYFDEDGNPSRITVP